MAQFFDFGEAAIPDVTGEAPESVSIPMVCPAHGQGTTITDGWVCTVSISSTIPNTWRLRFVS